MGREKKGGPGVGSSAKDRHRRKGNVIDWTAPLPPGLNARPEKPKLSSKHKSYLEWVENKNKKKKLEFEVMGGSRHRLLDDLYRCDTDAL
jgi:hypothetical protein